MSLAADAPALGFVGAGRAGTALSLALSAAGYPVTAVYSRTPEHARAVARATGAMVCEAPADAARLSELLFLTVPDGAVSSIAREIADGGGFRSGGAVVHTSGSLTLAALGDATESHTLTGMFHPLQALAGAGSAALLKGSYIGIEAAPDLFPVLCAMATDLGAVPLELAGKEKLPYHIAAVLAANYPLALLSAASALMQAAGIERETALPALLPLLRGSVANLEASGGVDGLTGPVIRGDASTVARHIEYLRERHPELVDAYRALGILALTLAADTSPNHARVREALAE